MKNTKWNTIRERRQAFLLLLVLLVVSGISLTALSLSQSMLMNYEESLIMNRAIQARCAADSGVASARLFLANTKQARLDAGGHWNNPALFQAVNVVPDSDPQELCHFSIMAPNLDEFGYYSSARYGLQNESARLNLNALVTIDKLMSAASGLSSAMGGGAPDLSSMGIPTNLADSAGTAAASGGVGQQLLMGLPGMTVEIADAILDFIDADEEPRPYGAESEYYSQLQTPYSAANGPLVSVDELLLVRGVTAQHLFGLDQNRNGVVDGFEQAAVGSLAADSSMPNAILDPMTQQLMPQLGWAQYLTLYSREKNVDATGAPRININGTDLTQLQTDLSNALGNEEWASYILAYRALGPGNPNATRNVSTGNGGQGGGGGTDGGGPGGRDGGGRDGGGGPEGRDGPNRDGGPNRGPGGPGGPGGRPGAGPGGPGSAPPARGGGGPPPGGQGGPRGGRLGLIDATRDLHYAFDNDQNFIPRGRFVAMQLQRGGGQGSGRGPGGPGGQGGTGQGGPGGGRGPDGDGRGGSNDRDGGGRDGDRGGRDGDRGGRDGDRGGRDGGRGDGGRGDGGRGSGGSGGGGSGTVGARQEDWKSDAVQIDLTAQPKGQFNQILDLIGSTITVEQADQPVTYRSPFQNNPLEMAIYLPLLMDKLTTVDGPIIPGRININEAPVEIISGIPGMTSELVEQLMAARAEQNDSENRKFETWPMVEGYVTLQQMRSLLPLVTGGGDVYRAQVIGYYEQGAAFARIESVIDAAEAVPTVVSYRRLDHLGRGFTNAVLGQRSMGLPVSTSTAY